MTCRLLRLPLLLWMAGSCTVLAQTTRPPESFTRLCASCHGGDGRGGERAPAAAARTRSESGIRDLIHAGIPTRGMPAFDLQGTALDEVVAFVRRIPTPDDAQTAAIRIKPLPFTAVVQPQPGDWPTYHGQLSGNRHSSLTQITPANISSLSMRWMYTVPGAGNLEVTPVVIDGIMYVTASNSCFALNAATGEMLWQFRRERTKGMVGDAASNINRGVAVLGRRLFMVTDNAHLLALDRATGKLEWETTMADYRENYGATSAPLVVGDLVVSGTSGGDEGIRGFVAAFSAETGKEAWRFWTVPKRGEPGSETWKGKDIDHGCASTWLTGTYDASSGLLFWTSGNPCPDYNGDERVGDNLYSDSVLALEAKTGKLVWHYQFTPHDLHDWDAQQTPMLVDADWQGARRKLLLQASRNGFFYVLDRTNGKLLLARPFVEKLTWARGIGQDGRPELVPGTDPTPGGVRACPAVEGATNWMSTAFDSRLGYFFVSALEKCSWYVKTDEDWRAGQSFYGGATRDIPEEPGQKVLRAIDYRTGRIVWSHVQSGKAHTWGGVLSTASGLVFFAEDNGAFSGFDSASGKRLWSFGANQNWKASPMSYLIGGNQFVSVAAGPNILTFALAH